MTSASHVFWLRTPADARTLFAIAAPNRRRAFLALCAGAVATLIVLHQGHFRLSLHDPQSFVVMTTHRCGWVLMLSCAWCAYECGRVLFEAAPAWAAV